MSAHQHSTHHNMPSHLLNATVQPSAFSIERILSSGNTGSTQPGPAAMEKPPRSKCEKSSSSPDERTSIYSAVLNCLQSRLILKNRDAPCLTVPPSSSSNNCLHLREPEGGALIQAAAEERGPTSIQSELPPRSASQTERSHHHPTGPSRHCHLEVGGPSESEGDHPAPPEFFLRHLSFLPNFSEAAAFADESARTDCPAHLPAFGRQEARFCRLFSMANVKTWFQNRRMKHKKMQRCRSPITNSAATHQPQASRYATLTEHDQVVGSSSLDDGLSLSSAEEDEATRDRREAEDNVEDRHGAVSGAVAIGTEHKERMFPAAPLLDFNSNEHCSSSLALSPSVYQRSARLFSDNSIRP